MSQKKINLFLFSDNFLPIYSVYQQLDLREVELVALKDLHGQSEFPIDPPLNRVYWGICDQASDISAAVRQLTGIPSAAFISDATAFVTEQSEDEVLVTRSKSLPVWTMIPVSLLFKSLNLSTVTSMNDEIAQQRRLEGRF